MLVCLLINTLAHVGVRLIVSYNNKSIYRYMMGEINFNALIARIYRDKCACLWESASIFCILEKKIDPYIK